MMWKQRNAKLILIKLHLLIKLSQCALILKMLTEYELQIQNLVFILSQTAEKYEYVTSTHTFLTF